MAEGLVVGKTIAVILEEQRRTGEPLFDREERRGLPGLGDPAKDEGLHRRSKRRWYQTEVDPTPGPTGGWWNLYAAHLTQVPEVGRFAPVLGCQAPAARRANAIDAWGPRVRSAHYLNQPRAHQFPEQVARRVLAQNGFRGDLGAVARPSIKKQRQDLMLALGQPQPSPVVWAGGIALQAPHPAFIAIAPPHGGAIRRLERWRL